ncbi:hypothetical protein ACFL9T_12350 [Thermodesulfobacteriota bacterium]
MDEKKIEGKSPQDAIRQLYLIDDLLKRLIIFFNCFDSLRDIQNFQFMLRELLLDKVDILHRSTDVTLRTSVQDDYTHCKDPL